MEYKVKVESVGRLHGCYNGVIIEESFENYEDAVRFYNGIDIVCEYKMLDKFDKKREYLEKNIARVVDDGEEYIEASTAGKHYDDTYDMYYIERDGEMLFISIEKEDGIITLREHDYDPDFDGASDSDFADLEPWVDDRWWDSSKLTDEEYEHFFDEVLVLDEK